MATFPTPRQKSLVFCMYVAARPIDFAVLHCLRNKNNSTPLVSFSRCEHPAFRRQIYPKPISSTDLTSVRPTIIPSLHHLQPELGIAIGDILKGLMIPSPMVEAAIGIRLARGGEAPSGYTVGVHARVTMSSSASGGGDSQIGPLSGEPSSDASKRLECKIG